MSCRCWLGPAAAAALLPGMAAPAAADTLDRNHAEKTIRIAYREDAVPFSYEDADTAEPAGDIVELCRAAP
ncbi:MAG TPA: hypothetical protein VG651_11120 [Stellaceae bacterium]|nr:hypothetical protein [Stellaceae bacterium]